MDFFEILVLLIFVVIPLLQHLLRRGDAGEGEESAAPPHRERPDGEAAASAGAEEEWSADWGEWPSDDEVPAEGPYIPEAVRVHTPVVSLEELEVDHAARAARPAHRPLTPPRRQSSRRPRIADLLDESPDLRTAIILSEVLGPPAALRGPRRT